MSQQTYLILGMELGDLSKFAKC